MAVRKEGGRVPPRSPDPPLTGLVNLWYQYNSNFLTPLPLFQLAIPLFLPYLTDMKPNPSQVVIIDRTTGEIVRRMGADALISYLMGTVGTDIPDFYRKFKVQRINVVKIGMRRKARRAGYQHG